MAARKRRETDPPRQLAELAASLEGAAPARLYVVRGEERYFREKAIDLVRRRADELGWELAAHALKDPDFDPARLSGDLAGGSLFATARCVIVRDAAPLLKKDGRKDSAFVRGALAFAESDELEGCVIVSAESIRADSALAKGAERLGGRTIGCRRLWDSAPPWNPDPRQSELVQWLVAAARKRRLPLTPDQALYVAAATGNDLFALEAQLDKLAVSGERALQEIVGWDATGSPFQVADDLVAGDAARAVAGTVGLFRGGFQEKSGTRLVDRAGLSAILLSSVLRQVRQATAGAMAALAGDDPAKGAARAGWSIPPRRRGDFAERVERRSPREWTRMLEEAAELELRSRTGRALDENDFCLFALRWRARRPEPAGRR